MLLLHKAAIFPFVTCQFLFLPSSSSSETVDKMECMERCSMRFLNIVSSSGIPSIEQLCGGFVEMKECVLGCPEGAELMKLVAGMVPQSFELVTEMCEGEGITGNLSPDVMREVLSEADDIVQLNHCLIGCERYLHVFEIGGPDGRPGLGVMCETWATYEHCVIGCPEGAEVMTYVQKMMPSIFKTIEDICSPVSSTGTPTEPVFYLETTTPGFILPTTDNIRYSEYSEPSTEAPIEFSSIRRFHPKSTTYYPDLSELTTQHNKYFDALADTKDSSESMLKCKGKCLKNLDGLRVSSGVKNLCVTYKSMKTCLEECFGDPQMAIFMFGDVGRILPQTVAYLKNNCNDDTPTSLDMEYYTWELLLEEEKEADEMKFLYQFYKK